MKIGETLPLADPGTAVLDSARPLRRSIDGSGDRLSLTHKSREWTEDVVAQGPQTWAGCLIRFETLPPEPNRFKGRGTTPAFAEGIRPFGTTT